MSKRDILLRRIEEYVRSCDDLAITYIEVAEHFSISPSYASQLLQLFANTHSNEYVYWRGVLTRKKVEAAHD
ncbi:MAG: hypothetical protein QXW42_04315 [Thermofilum sp.]